MKKYFKRLLEIYVFGTVLSIFCSLIFFYWRSNLVFVIIFVLTFFISYLMPLWFKLFLKTKQYDGQYRTQLLNFAKSHGISLNNIFVRKSKHSNASSFGLLNNKAVTFNSLTLEKHPFDEIEAVIAHEMGHQANYGIYIYTIIVAALLVFLTMINLWIYAYFNGGLIQFLFICLGTSILIFPFILMISRYMEGLADKYAIKILKDPSALGRFLERVLKYEKEADEVWPKNPPFLLRVFLTHPWIYDRIKSAKSR